jgi:uncharacterized protein
MAFSSLLTLLDDIASILDDVAVMTKVAAKKTAGVLGDDLALNAQQVTGAHPERELPIVWAVCKGSLINKAILVPLALIISAWFNPLIIVLLMLGGAFLCYEGFEKVLHKLLHHKEDQQHHLKHAQAIADTKINILEVEDEKQKIKGAVRTDFILSAEIIVISLGVIKHLPITTQILVLSLIAIAMTIGVYGLVALIVKLDDFGLWLIKRSQRYSINKLKATLQQNIGLCILKFAPYLMKALTVLGTAAMFMVGGSIVLHGVEALHYSIANLLALIHSSILKILTASLIDFIAGIIIGAMVYGGVLIITKAYASIIKQRKRNKPQNKA